MKHYLGIIAKDNIKLSRPWRNILNLYINLTEYFLKITIERF